MKVFNRLPTNSKFDIRSFYSGKPRTNRDSCVAMFGPAGIPLLGCRAINSALWNMYNMRGWGRTLEPSHHYPLTCQTSGCYMAILKAGSRKIDAIVFFLCSRIEPSLINFMYPAPTYIYHQRKEYTSVDIVKERTTNTSNQPFQFNSYINFACLNKKLGKVFKKRKQREREDRHYIDKRQRQKRRW